MTITEALQRKTTLKEKILENLNFLIEFHSFKQIEIARRLGYEKDAFSKLKTDDNYFGSPHLLAGLSLIIELETLKKERNEVLAAKRAIQLLAAPGASFVLNEAEPKLNSTKVAPDKLTEAVRYSIRRRKK